MDMMCVWVCVFSGGSCEKCMQAGHTDTAFSLGCSGNVVTETGSGTHCARVCGDFLMCTCAISYDERAFAGAF